ncbi:MAG: aminomethyl-transferring glycine dehydrogenase subunit GcvPB [Candidatus Ratteibacteria bacterium]|nr:aminomethyl-transferring glycine dehydrogenase subunit GcvPB [Candidatus Ratteibacteria bacterium]
MSKLIFEKGACGRNGISLPEMDVPFQGVGGLIPKNLLRKELPLPELSEPEVVRHYTNLSKLNFSVDGNFYPLGSCTMKYNPKINEELAALPGFTQLHPYQGEESVQGALELMYNLEKNLSEIVGMERMTLQPAAGAHGELTGILMLRAFFKDKGESRKKIIIPDASHGTNPASAVLGGFEIVEVATDNSGGIDIEALKKVMNEEAACLMLTNPSTLGLFEENILEVSSIVHKAGGLLYGDGANLNALLGKARFGDMGFDLVHLNLHKTFAAPHGGGGPGGGPLGVKKQLIPYLPVPLVDRQGGRFFLNYDLPGSIGRMRSFYGNFLVMLKAYVYILSLGEEGLRKAAENAVLNANYLRAKLKDYYELPYKKICLHEVIFSGSRQKAKGVRTLDIAKRLIDFGMHPPTIYFPLNVPEALMIEPTETETKETLDYFIEIMKRIAGEAEENPQLLHQAPHNAPVGRLDEAKAAREIDVAWQASG